MNLTIEELEKKVKDLEQKVKNHSLQTPPHSLKYTPLGWGQQQDWERKMNSLEYDLRKARNELQNEKR